LCGDYHLLERGVGGRQQGQSGKFEHGRIIAWYP
jgi:hypothetical protein